MKLPAGRRGGGLSKAHRAVLVLFFVIGVVSWTVGVRTALSTRQFMQRAVEVPGTVAGLGRQGDTYAPWVAYTDRSGQPRLLRSTVSSSPSAFFVGEQVSVLYDPADPAFPLHARISSFGQLWSTSLFALAFGAGCAGLAVAQWIYLRRRGRAR